MKVFASILAAMSLVWVGGAFLSAIAAPAHVEDTHASAPEGKGDPSVVAKQTTSRDDVGDARDYQREPGSIVSDASAAPSHDSSGDASAERRAANCLNADAQSLHHAETLRGAALRERRAADARVQGTRRIQVSPRVTGRVGNPLATTAVAPALTSSTEGAAASPCLPSDR